MKKFLLFLILTIFVVPNFVLNADASLVSDRAYRIEQSRNYRHDVKDIKELFKVHNKFSNRHDIESLRNLYAENYVNNDGFDKNVYFKSVKETWDECSDLTYTVKISSIDIKGDFASVSVEETATGTILDVMGTESVAGEIHSKSNGLYYLSRVNGKWLISGEVALADESSLLYGDARFMNIEIQSPNQVSAGENYTATVKIEADENTFIVGSIDQDPVTFPSGSPNSKLRALPQSQVLERILKANTNNLNEYAIASLAISKVRNISEENYKVYMAGLACIMKRINVVPKNNYIEFEGKNENDSM
ncbi:nuclear transport factor 2 family protein [bacterium]|nr:nuclear transport factor 2 family protein [bacterium]